MAGPLTVDYLCDTLDAHVGDREEVREFWHRMRAAIKKGERATVMAMAAEVIQWNVGDISWPLFVAICRSVDQRDRELRMIDNMANFNGG